MKIRLGGVCEAGGSKQLETGKWRAFRPVVKADECNRCRICFNFCPEGCIQITDKSAEINLFYCKGCMICAQECPRKAIRTEAEGE